MGSEATVKVLRTIGELEEIRVVWESWSGHRESEMEPFLTFLRSNPGTVRPHVLVVYCAGRPDAILVGRIDRGRVICRLGYLQVSPHAQIMCFVYGALRGNPSKENCDLMVSEIVQSLSQGEADVAYMNFLREGSDLCHLARKKPGLLNRDYVPITQPHFAATLPASMEEFYQGLSPKVRKNQKWQSKKLMNHFSGAVRIHCYREATDLDKMIQDVEQVAKKSYQRGLGVGFFDTLMVRSHWQLKAQQGRLRSYVLYLAEKPCAFWIGEINQGTFESDSLAYDAEFGKHSPGMFLILNVIESFCDGNREGVTGVDFGRGNAQYKQVLSNQSWTETSLYIFAPTFKGICLNMARSLVGGLDQVIKKVLARTNLLQKIKKAWRNHAKPKEAVHADA
jgi:hypothetical protein